jgi:hypothetical protein
LLWQLQKTISNIYWMIPFVENFQKMIKTDYWLLGKRGEDSWVGSERVSKVGHEDTLGLWIGHCILMVL